MLEELWIDEYDYLNYRNVLKVATEEVIQDQNVSESVF